MTLSDIDRNIYLQLALNEINFVFVWNNKNMFIDMLGYASFLFNEFF